MQIIIACNQYEAKEVQEIVKTMVCNFIEWEKGNEKLRYKIGEGEIEAEKVQILIV